MVREIERILGSRPTVEGAGVHLKRAFGHDEVPLLDPFLLLDDFGSDDPRDYVRGFPWHPHRGIETVTYVLEGRVTHEDSIGNSGTIDSGDAQWMTAGSGIIHQEMPAIHEGYMRGFQLWVNLPSSDKMMHPRYRDVLMGQIPEVTRDNGISVRVVAGEVAGVRGPVRDLVVDAAYLDVSMSPGSVFEHPIQEGHRAFSYVVEGQARFAPTSKEIVRRENLVVFRDGDGISVKSGEKGARFLLISGTPLGEPVAWYGPIVMNTREELGIAFEEYRKKRFLRHQ